MSQPGIYLKGGEHGVVLIHGLTGSPFELKPLARALHRNHFTVRAPCLAGHGTSLDDLRRTSWQDWYATVRGACADLAQECSTISVAGLCMGALLALQMAAEERDKITAVGALSTTLFYDGWSLPWYRFLLPISYLPPIRYFYSYEERPPYGVKDERMRQEIVTAIKEGGLAYSHFPSHAMHELFKLIRTVKRTLPQVTAPTIILHALEDDVASVRNADYVEQHIGATQIRKVLLPDTYHMLTLDLQKQRVAQETVDFFRAVGAG